MAWHKAVIVSSVELGVCHNNVLLGKSIDKVSPHLIGSAATESLVRTREASHHFDGTVGVASIYSFVVAVELSECFFENHGPESLVVRWLGQRSVAPAIEGNEVINHDGGRETKVIEIDTVDARTVQLLVKEQVLDHVWISHAYALEGGQEPAVTQTALVERLVLEAAFSPE